MKYTKVRKYEKIFDDNKEQVSFKKLDDIITIQRNRYKNCKITLNKYYQYKNNIENFEKLCLEYWGT